MMISANTTSIGCHRSRLWRNLAAADNTIYPADDFPPYLTIFAVGHIVVPLLVWTDFHVDPPLWLRAAIWLPVTGALCLALLPVMKGAASGLCRAVDLVRG